MLCVVDDAHWLDPATRRTRSSSAPSRIGADRVVMVFATRDERPRPRSRPHGLPELARDRARGRRIPRPARPAPRGRRRPTRSPNGSSPRRAATRWPCWSCRPSSLRPSSRGSSPLPAQLHLTARVEQVFLDRSRRLPADVQACCCSRQPTTPASRRRAQAVQQRALGLDEDALETAVASGLVVEDGSVVAVRHPLVRSAIYQAATGEDRRRAHRALAEALAGVGDPDRETWHRAAAADGPDDELGRRPRASSGPEHSVAAATPPPWRPTSGQQR